MASSPPKTHFKTLRRVELDYSPVKFTQYESQRTGMHVVVIDQPGPKVMGSLVVATEIHDDSGAPHTLEHLVFTGSKSYAYSGLLDKLAARSGTRVNALTDTAWTAYSLTAGGWTGFAQILPVYLEHLICPTLTDEACYTEVHHVDGDGNDKGVVYSEMEGYRLNSVSHLTSLRLKRLLYPKGNGFRYYTGGLLEPLRELTADRIREFHKERYQPKNLRVIITGEVNHQELLQVLDKFEDTILISVPSFDAPFTRPWVDTEQTSPIAETKVEIVQYPDKQESWGHVRIYFLGPKHGDFTGVLAMKVLLRYLMGSSLRPLPLKLVEEDHVCTSADCDTTDWTELLIRFRLFDVKIAEIEAVEELVHSRLRAIAEDQLDMKYMQLCIKGYRMETMLDREEADTEWNSAFLQFIRDDHLYGDRGGRDLKKLATLEDFDALEKWTDRQWRDFLSKWLIKANHISTLGLPSIALLNQNDADEKARITKQKIDLGPEGLEARYQRLKEAHEKKDVPIPDALLEPFLCPDASSVRFLCTTTARAGKARSMGVLDNDIQRLIDQDDRNSSLFLHFEDVPSNFVRIRLDMCTGSVPPKIRPLILLYMKNFFATPVMRDGNRMETVYMTRALQDVTIKYSLTFVEANAEMLRIAIATTPENYERGIGWLRTLLFDAIHDKKRLLAHLNEGIRKEIDEEGTPDKMWATYEVLQHERESTIRACSTLNTQKVRFPFAKLLNDDEDMAIAQFTQLCQTLHRPENFRICVSANVSKLTRPVSAWSTLSADLDTIKPMEPLDNRLTLLTPRGKRPGNTCVIVPVDSQSSSNTVAIGTSIPKHAHPDMGPLLVARAFFSACDGPFWKAVRDTGLANSAHLHQGEDLVHHGLRYKIVNSNDPSKALQATRDMVKEYANGTREITQLALGSAKSEIVREMAMHRPTLSKAALHSYQDQVLKGLDKDWFDRMLPQVQALTADDVRRVVREYFVPILDPATSNLYVACGVSILERVEEGLRAIGYEPEVRTEDSLADDYWPADEEGEEEEEGAEDDDGGDEEEGDADDDE